jgi:glucokinase
MPDAVRVALGIDIGVTQVKWARATFAGKILQQGTFDTRADSPGWPESIREFVDQTEREHGGTDAIGIAAPGLAAPDGSCIAWMQGRLDAVQGLDWTKHLARREPVRVLNDAQAALLGEVWIGAATGSRNVMLLTLGTGVGGALMVDGRLLRGHLGRAGHLGHLSLNPDGTADIVGTPGSLEDAIGNCTLSRRSMGRFASTHELVAAHQAGDAEATGVWLRSVHLLACGIASLINVADPEVVIIGGGIARAGESLFAPLREKLDRLEWRAHGSKVHVVRAMLGEHAGALGAARNVIECSGSEMG